MELPQIPPIRSPFTSSRLGLVPAPGASTGLLRHDATWAQQPLNYIGTVAGASVPNTATTAGDYYVIASAGTSQTKTWKAFDIAIYRGSSGQWDQLAYTDREVPTKTENNQLHASRMGADYLQSDGATSGRRIQTVYGALMSGGSDHSEVDYGFDVPTSAPSGGAYIVVWSSGTGIVTANSLQIFISGNDLVIIELAATAGDYRQVVYSGWRTANSGRRVRMTFAFTGDSLTAPVVYQDGVALSGGVETFAGSAPNWAHAAMATTYHHRGFNWHAGYFRPGRPVNRKYAQADVDFVQLTGRLPAPDALGGSMGGPLSTRDFSAGVDSFTALAGTVDGNIDGIVGIDDTLRFYANASNAAHGARIGVAMQGGARYRIRGQIYIPTGQATVTSATIFLAGAGSIATTFAVESGTQTFNANAAWQTIDLVVLLMVGFSPGTVDIYFNAANSFVGANSTANDVAYLKGLRVDAVGAFSDSIIQPCRVLDDATQNNRASLLVGFTPVTQRKDWRIPAWVDMSSTGNKQLLAGALFDRPQAQAIDTIEDEVAGTPTYSVGDGTTATKYTASTARTAGRNRFSLSANFPADSAKTGLYANVTVTGGSSELIIVRGHRT